MYGLAEIAELLEAHTPAKLRIRRVDPVVHAVERRVHAKLGVDLREARQQHLPYIRVIVAIGVGEIENIRRAGDDDATLPRQHAMCEVQMIGKYCAFFELSVAIHILEQPNSSQGLLRDGVFRHFDDEHAASLVERQSHRTGHPGAS